MSQELEAYLEGALKKLEKAYDQIIQTKGYCQEAEDVKMLQELLKEQTPYENTNYSISSSR